MHTPCSYPFASPVSKPALWVHFPKGVCKSSVVQWHQLFFFPQLYLCVARPKIRPNPQQNGFPSFFPRVTEELRWFMAPKAERFGQLRLGLKLMSCFEAHGLCTFGYRVTDELRIQGPGVFPIYPGVAPEALAPVVFSAHLRYGRLPAG